MRLRTFEWGGRNGASVLLLALGLLFEAGQLGEEDRALKLGHAAMVAIADVDEAGIGLAVPLVMKALEGFSRSFRIN